MAPKIAPRALRDVFLFLFGALGVVHETFFSKLDRPSLLMFFGACMGVTFVLRADERKNGRKK